jgi:hypothetical protein
LPPSPKPPTAGLLPSEVELLRMFNKAAADVTKEDIQERESLLGGFAGRD